MLPKKVLTLLTCAVFVIGLTLADEEAQKTETGEKESEWKPPPLPDTPDQFKQKDPVKKGHYKEDGEHNEEYDHEAIWGKKKISIVNYLA